MNLVVLKGRLVRDVTLLFGKTGIPYTSLVVDVNRYSKEKDLTDLILCTAFSKTAEFIDEYFRKGQEILIRGNVKVDSYEKDGNKISKQYIAVETVEFVGSKKENTETKEEETQDSEEFPW